MAEFIACTRHNGVYWRDDNGKVWDIMFAVFFNTEGWSWISGFQARRDGRGAYFAFKSHFLGGGTTHALLKAAKDVLRNCYYEAEYKNFGFEQYVTKLVRAHTHIVQYGAVDDQVSNKNRIINMIDNCRSTDAHLLAAIAHVRANPATYQVDFDVTANYLKECLGATVPKDKRNRELSSLNGGRNGGRGPGGRGGRGRGGQRDGRGGRGGGRFIKSKRHAETDNPNIDISARSYNDKEWKTLSLRQQDSIRELRGKRGRGSIEELESKKQKNQAQTVRLEVASIGAAAPAPAAAAAVTQGAPAPAPAQFEIRLAGESGRR